MGVSCGYHCTARPVSFGKGQSAVHTAAYNARTQLNQEREGRSTRDYSKHDGAVLFEGIFAPKDAPEWTHDRQQLWNRAEAAERQANGQPARNMIVAFPHELDQQQREWMLKDFLREAFARQGMIADAAMHAPDAHGDQRNYHAHILLTMRKLDGEEFAKTKCRDWNSKAQLEAWREGWAEKGAHALERAGYPVEAARWQHGHKTLGEQRAAAVERGDMAFADSVDREATMHKGPKLSGMERKGLDGSDRLEAVKAVIERNELRFDIKLIEAELNRLESDPEKQQKLESAAKAAEAAPKPGPADPVQPRPGEAVTPEELARRQETQLKMEAALRADNKALHEPSAKAFGGEGARDAASKIGQEARTERREEAFWARQEDWHASRRLPPPEPTPPAVAKSLGLQVVDKVSGAVSSLADFMSGVATSAQPENRANMKTFVSDPAARKEQQLARLAAIQNEREAAVAVERIARDMEQGKNLNAQDVRKLTHQHQEQIKTFGDDGMRQIVDEARKCSEQYWKGDGRERER